MKLINSYKKSVICFNGIAILTFMVNNVLIFNGYNNLFSTISCVVFLFSFYIALWLNSYNKIFAIIKWSILLIAIIFFTVFVNDVALPNWILVTLSYSLLIPYFGTMVLFGKLIGPMGEEKAFYICIGGFLLVCLFISIVQEILKYKRKKDGNEKV